MAMVTGFTNVIRSNTINSAARNGQNGDRRTFQRDARNGTAYEMKRSSPSGGVINPSSNPTARNRPY